MTSKEAFNDLNKRNEALKTEKHFHIGEKVMSIMKKLAERDTPKKPIVNIDNGIREYNCGVCVCMLDISQLKEVNFCPKCGNKIDWS